MGRPLLLDLDSTSGRERYGEAWHDSELAGLVAHAQREVGVDVATLHLLRSGDPPTTATTAAAAVAASPSTGDASGRKDQQWTTVATSRTCVVSRQLHTPLSSSGPPRAARRDASRDWLTPHATAPH